VLEILIQGDKSSNREESRPNDRHRNGRQITVGTDCLYCHVNGIYQSFNISFLLGGLLPVIFAARRRIAGSKTRSKGFSGDQRDMNLKNLNEFDFVCKTPQQPGELINTDAAACIQIAHTRAASTTTDGELFLAFCPPMKPLRPGY
jgi:hypothetical protein